MSGAAINSFILAPSAFLGDLSVLNDSGILTFDHRIFETGGAGNPILPYEVRLEGPGGQARWTGATPVGVTPWTQVVVPFAASAWDISSGTWIDLLSNVTSLRIRIEHVDNSISGRDFSNIDNITLAAVPEPSSLASAVLGLASLAGYAGWKRVRSERKKE